MAVIVTDFLVKCTKREIYGERLSTIDYRSYILHIFRYIYDGEQFTIYLSPITYISAIIMNGKKVGKIVNIYAKDMCLLKVCLSMKITMLILVIHILLAVYYMLSSVVD